VRRLLIVLGLWGSGCVYPATEPTGMELSWRFIETNAADGEDAIRIRTCEGVQTEQVAIEISDIDTPARQGVFRFDCIEGYQTLTALQTEASDAFIRLDPGAYAIAMVAEDDAEDARIREHLDAREIAVEERGITIVTWEVSRAPVSWTLELSGGETCDSLALALYYANPETDLAEYVPDEEQSLPLYRQELRSDLGLGVSAQTIECSSAPTGIHRFDGLDRAEYLLEVVVDGDVCSLRVDLRPGLDTASVIDLANLPCAG